MGLWFMIELRGGEALTILGRGFAEREFPWKIEFVFSWLTIVLIAIGVLLTVIRYKRMVDIRDFQTEPSYLIRRKFDNEYFLMALACSTWLLFSIVVPYVSKGYAASRIYFQMMVILSPFVLIGCITVARLLKAKPYRVISAVLIPYFMCTSGMMYQAFNVTEALVLNSRGREYDSLYVHDQESSAAEWLYQNYNPRKIINTDYTGYHRLVSEGGLPSRPFNDIDFPRKRKDIEGYIYLRYFNVVNGKLLDENYKIHEIAEYQHILLPKNRIYSNGGSDIYE
jgi:uncharacterized membrane protein